jgi:ubiquinone/menaquinone biosynthesis C-methylase UbiE
MRLKDCIPQPVRNIFRSLLHISGKDLERSPADVVKANTKEAFEFFYEHDDFIDQHYLSPSRLALYELVADYCQNLLMTANVEGIVRIADVGCGTGHMLEALRRRLVSQCKVELYGLDFSNAGLSRAEELIPDAIFVAQDIYENQLPSDFFDLVLCIETLEHLHQPEKCLDQLLRLCKQGCNVVITVPNGEKDS